MQVTVAVQVAVAVLLVAVVAAALAEQVVADILATKALSLDKCFRMLRLADAQQAQGPCL